jgi:hypothetical protein
MKEERKKSAPCQKIGIDFLRRTYMSAMKGVASSRYQQLKLIN